MRNGHAALMGALLPLVWLVPASVHSQALESRDLELILAGLPARSIGPANMGGRITDVDVVESDPRVMYVAAATGGVWKTTDGGATWTPLFDQQATLCIGDVAVSQSHPNVVWVGTGEANPRNSVSWGDGVYKSIDGGQTWTNVGLTDTRHIGRIVTHPTNPDIVYVAALGHLWGANRERGVFKTSDGGKTWRHVQFIDENTGAIDLAIDPVEPDTLYAAAYQVRRDGFSGGLPRVQTGPAGGLYKTTDGGQSWHKLSQGLPSRPYGRCGLAIFRKDPRIVYAVVQTDKTNPWPKFPTSGKECGPIDLGGVFRSDDRGQTWTKVNDLCPRPFYFGQIRIDPSDDRRVYVLGVSLHHSDDGGRTFSTCGRGVHADHHALWINPKESSHLLLGNDGGVYVSTDKGHSWQPLRCMALGQFYGIAVDQRQPYRVYGGLQDNGSWFGPSATRSTEGIALNSWRPLAGNDGFACLVDPAEPTTIYSVSQYGGLVRIDTRSNKTKHIRPVPPIGQGPYRFNWNTPLVLSRHDSRTLYFGGNVVFKSENRGNRWEVISPDLTQGPKGPGFSGGHSISALAESPLRAGLLLAGTDDGRVHVTANGGKVWTDLSRNLPDLPLERWITRLEWSQHAEGTAYLTADRHRQEDLQPYIYRTTDFGVTWTRVTGNLRADAPVQVIRESSKNKDLLFAGTERGLYLTLDGGRRWHRVQNGLPPGVPVYDLVIHPRDRDLVIGTHGRSVYVLDIGPLEQLTPAALAQAVYLFEAKPTAAYQLRTPLKPSPELAFTAPNPPNGAVIYYFLKEEVSAAVTLSVANETGQTVGMLSGPKQAGLHRLAWSLQTEGPKDSFTLMQPGVYTVTLAVGQQKLSRKVQITGPGR